jgi:hypothetical protein
MNLKEKIQTIIIDDSGNLQKICFIEDLAEEFAIGFLQWIIINCNHKNLEYLDLNRLLEIYKKEKGL